MTRDLADTVKALRDKLTVLTYVMPFLATSCEQVSERTFTATAYSAGAMVPLLTPEQIDAIVPVFEPAIRDLIAEATADALEAAAQRLENIGQRLLESMPPDIAGAHNCRELAKVIRALIPADIAARKGVERMATSKSFPALERAIGDMPYLCDSDIKWREQARAELDKARKLLTSSFKVRDA
jgi:hypothetical protein